jgi:hypothetical protein
VSKTGCTGDYQDYLTSSIADLDWDIQAVIGRKIEFLDGNLLAFCD